MIKTMINHDQPFFTMICSNRSCGKHQSGRTIKIRKHPWSAIMNGQFSQSLWSRFHRRKTSSSLIESLPRSWCDFLRAWWVSLVWWVWQLEKPSVWEYHSFCVSNDTMLWARFREYHINCIELLSYTVLWVMSRPRASSVISLRKPSVVFFGDLLCHGG